MPLNLTQRLLVDHAATAAFTLSLTAEERTRSRHFFLTDEGQGVYLRLDRGTVLRHGDLLQSDDRQTVVRVVAKPEPVMTVTAQTPLDLLRAAYHLGNRHVSLEVTASYLRLAPDPVLKSMLLQLGLAVTETIAPFAPEAGAYGHHHSADSGQDQVTVSHQDREHHSHEHSHL
ncbi:MAG: hypothetical protein Kow00121_63580 [Elainellaceae cyanobacterium]